MSHIMVSVCDCASAKGSTKTNEFHSDKHLIRCNIATLWSLIVLTRSASIRFWKLLHKKAWPYTNKSKIKMYNF